MRELKSARRSGFGHNDLPSSSTPNRFYQGFRRAMRRRALSSLGELFLKNNRHVDRHSWQKHVAARDSEHLICVLGIEDLKVSRHDFSLTRTILESCLNLSNKCFDTAFRREGENSPQGIFNFDWSLKVGEAGVDAGKASPYFKHDSIDLLR